MASVIPDVGGGDIAGGDDDNDGGGCAPSLDGVGSFPEVDNWLGSSSYATQEGWQQPEAPLANHRRRLDALWVAGGGAGRSLCEVEEETIVQLLAPIIDAVDGDKNLPIDVEKLPEVADLREVIVVKQEVEEDVGTPGKKKRAAVGRSERLKMLKKEE
ncbi:hypothetical protein ZWY2020_029904 [Hordeum vulgare]|nr:hypothetical protein ZWY2020_029904 [Hordeum vulgare]